MEKLSNVNKTDILPEFQTFLPEKKLALEKNVFFYALRASKYLTYANKKKISLLLIGWADTGSPTKNHVGFRTLRRLAQPTYMSARGLLENIFAGLKSYLSNLLCGPFYGEKTAVKKFDGTLTHHQNSAAVIWV
jgi:hypothetical protein